MRNHAPGILHTISFNFLNNTSLLIQLNVMYYSHFKVRKNSQTKLKEVK